MVLMVALFSFFSRIFKGPTSSQVFVAPEFREVSGFSFLSVLWILQSSALFRMSQGQVESCVIEVALSKLSPSVLLVCHHATAPGS